MAHYAIGDIQGCFEPLQRLLEKIRFDPISDRLWLTGDLVNRGPDSLQVLRFLKSLPLSPRIVLGNHDLHLLAVAYHAIPANPKDTIQDILHADDKQALCTWLRQQPLLYHDPALGFTMTHAGILPQWDLSQASQKAQEVEQILAGENFFELLANLYGNQPSRWDEQLTGWERYRFIINSFTRMRFCSEDGALELTTKTDLANTPQGLLPWFRVPARATKDLKIIFGHWAALKGKIDDYNIFALDTGCVWGNCLTALRLEDQLIYHSM